MPHQSDAADAHAEWDAMADDSTDVQIIPGPSELQMIPLPEGCTRPQLVWLLTQKIPLNQYGLPIFFYRSDRLPSPDITGLPLTQADVDAATEGLVYYDGYPTLTSGQSFWNQLPHENFDQFMLFTKYLEQAELLGIRQLDLLAAAAHLDLAEVLSVSQEFYWNARARAHDLFSAAAEQKRRSLQIRKTENVHFDKAASLLTKLEERFTGDNADWIEELSAKEAFEVMEMLIKVQRLSLGLTGQHASSNAKTRDLPVEASPDYLIRELAKGATMGGEGSTDFASKLQALIGDPEQGMVLQEMILKISSRADAAQPQF